MYSLTESPALTRTMYSARPAPCSPSWHYSTRTSSWTSHDLSCRSSELLRGQTSANISLLLLFETSNRLWLIDYNVTLLIMFAPQHPVSSLNLTIKHHTLDICCNLFLTSLASSMASACMSSSQALHWQFLSLPSSSFASYHIALVSVRRDMK